MSTPLLEVADVLGITPTNAGVRLTRALGHLRELLLRHVEGPDISEFELPSFPDRAVT
jgi:hypothetical protein